MLKLLSEPLPPRCPTANAAGQLLVQTLRFEAICDLLVGGKRPYTSSVLSSRHIWQGLDPQRPAKQLWGHLVGELLTETPLCPAEGLGQLASGQPRGTNGHCSAQGGNVPGPV